MNDIKLDKFIESFAEHGISLSENAVSLLVKYTSEIKRFNNALHLVSSRDVNFLWSRHILDSCAPLLLGLIERGSTLLDIGSGAGLPGIPIAITSPNMQITMFESNQKKARFISRMIDILGLTNARILNQRFDSGTGKFNFCVSRAVYSDYNILPKISDSLLPYGKAIFFKGRDSLDNLPTANIIDDASYSSCDVIEMPGIIFEGRVLVVFTKKA